MKKKSTMKNILPKQILHGGGSGTATVTYSWIEEKELETIQYKLIFKVSMGASSAGNTHSAKITTTSTKTNFKTIEYKSSAAMLQSSIATWYKALRRIALVGLLSILVYVGIRIILTSISAEKAKYKKMFMNWIVAVCILFVLHYLMVLILTMSSKVTDIFLKKGEPNILVELPADTSVDGKALPGAKGDGEAATEDNLPVWSCSFVGYLRLLAGAYGEADSPTLSCFAYAIMYIIMVIYTCVFTFMYLRRVLYMAFLTMVAPLIALTYPLDKLKDNKAQALELWLREYIFNALVQPIHLILYVTIVSSIMDFVKDHPVYAIVGIGFLLPAEKFIRKLFGFSKANTFGQLTDAAMGATVMSGINKMSSLNKQVPSHSDNADSKIRTADESSDMDVPDVNIEDSNTANNTNTNTTQISRQSVENEYRNLRAQGLNTEEINQRIHTQFGNNDMINSIISGINSPGGASGTAGANSNASAGANALRVPRITPAMNANNRRSFGSKVSAGILNVGFEAKKRAIKSHPIKTIGKYTGMAFGGATLGLLGLAAGISTGDFGNAIKYASTGLGIGGSVGSTWGTNITEFTTEQVENFKKGFYGTEEYNNIKFDKNFLASEELRDIINNNDVHPEMRGGLVSEVKRNRAIADEVHQYHLAGITDADQITSCMKAGLTPEEGKYTIELAKTMQKGKINTPKKRFDYKQKYLDAFQSQNNTAEKSQKIEDMWNTATNIRFK